MTDQHQHDPEDRGYTEVITPAALDAMTGTDVPLRAGGPGGPIVGTARLAAGGVVEMAWDLGPISASLEVHEVDRDVMRSLARDYADRIDRLLAERNERPDHHPLYAEGYGIPSYLDVRKIAGTFDVPAEQLTPGRVTVPAWRPSRRQRLAWWWQGARERAGELVAGRRFDAEDGDR